MDFEVAGGLGFQAAAGADALEVAVEVELEEIGGVIGWAAGGLGLGVGEAQSLEVETLDISVDEASGGIGGDVVVEAGREKLDFGSVGAAQVAHGFGDRIASDPAAFKKTRGKVFTQAGKEAYSCAGIPKKICSDSRRRLRAERFLNGCCGFSRNHALEFRVERATGPLRRATRPLSVARPTRTVRFRNLRARLGGKLPPRTARLAVPP